ncbi:sulfatase-like hydrolase/transferase [Stieleria sp. TO1_6]|uniref:sulfatase-like hydrolase/transferase n=1 Tax=Stieleria tagensis TaxID=2956795 RepID=UPI0021BCC6CB|nr:sulfatase-like hydrolase/transferase [Stieleria tagensis]MCO8124545.1 sulfatase-like hydrolase/transferase [Stieleria tagensis]
MRWQIHVLAFCAALAIGGLTNLSLAADRPNIVLIMADDFGYECVGANGGLSYATPNIDRIAKDGARFTHCYAQPLCTPTRVQLMTGLYNFRNYTRFSELASDQRTFGHLLKDAGYATCFAHKWQLGKNRPDHFGFDEYAIHSPGRSHWGMKVIKNGTTTELPTENYGPDYFTDFACDFITRHKDEPFFVYFPIWLTHEPFDATPDSDDPSGRQDRKHFGDMIEYLDKCVGRVDETLAKLDLSDNTLFIFTGDNGTVKGIESKTDSGIVVGGKSRLTNAGTHVPLVVKWPDHVPPGTQSADLVDFTDFVPTLAEAADVSLPQTIPFDGQNFLTRITGGQAEPRKWIYLSLDPRKPDKRLPPGKRGSSPTVGPVDWCVRNQRWKLYQNGTFFDLQADPLEEHSITNDLTPEAQAAKEFLASTLSRFPDLKKRQRKSK